MDVQCHEILIRSGWREVLDPYISTRVMQPYECHESHTSANSYMLYEKWMLTTFYFSLLK